MLNKISLQSEAYGSTGNIGENFRRLLGAPTLDPLQTVVREAVQNIADAAGKGIGPEILVRVRRLSKIQQTFLRQHFFSSLPEERTSREKLSDFLARAEPIVLEICDFRTLGLGGPTRADRIPVDEEHTDFIDFLRNVGSPRNVAHGGGTYGFGKAALYRASRCSTIIVDSLVAGGGRGARRLIGCHIGASFERPEDGMRRRYTGRHWWGHVDTFDGTVDPVLDEGAESMAHQLGFPERGVGKSGTSIMILDYDTEEQTLEMIGKKLVEALLWNFWPRMKDDTPPEKRFSCRIEVDGRNYEIPKPEEVAPLHLFVKAMKKAEQAAGEDVREIVSLRPKKRLGNLSIERGLRAPRRGLEDGTSLFPEVSRHIALMRPVRLVVKYMEGVEFPDERVEWAGVFIADDLDEVERAFADSEPPAHDDWIPDNLPKGHAKTFVNVALRELKDAAREMGRDVRGHAPQDGSGPPLARVAERLGSALEGTAGGGAGPSRKGPGPTSSGKRTLRAKASRPLFVRLERDSIGPVAVFSTQVRQDAGKSGKVLEARASVAIDGAAASGVDDLGASPQVLAIRGVSDAPSGEGDRVMLGGSEGTFEIIVRMPHDAAVIVDATVLSGENS